MIGLEQILKAAGLTNLPAQILGRLGDAVDNELVKRGGEQVGRGVYEAIDAVMEAHGGRLTPEQAILAGQAVGAAIAQELRAVAALVEGYPQLQAAVVRAKVAHGSDSDEADAARVPRNAAGKALKRALSGLTPQG